MVNIDVEEQVSSEKTRPGVEADGLTNTESVTTTDETTKGAPDFWKGVALTAVCTLSVVLVVSLRRCTRRNTECVDLIIPHIPHGW